MAAAVPVCIDRPQRCGLKVSLGSGFDPEAHMSDSSKETWLFHMKCRGTGVRGEGGLVFV